MKEHFFVYGTLKSGHGNNDLLRHATFLGQAITDDNYLLGGRGCPFLWPDENGNKILGELYLVQDKNTFRNLDRLEGHPDFYCRHKRLVHTQNENFMAWIYEYQTTGGAGEFVSNPVCMEPKEVMVW